MRYHPLYWTIELKTLHTKAIRLLGEGVREPEQLNTVPERAFLGSIGMTSQNLYDYAEDYLATGQPDWDTVLLISAARRDYFLHKQRGLKPLRCMEESELPPREASLHGMAWLPRVIKKAEGFLAGTLCKEIMFCCGGDRAFFLKYSVHPADFLRVVWAAGSDHDRIAAFVRECEIRAQAA